MTFTFYELVAAMRNGDEITFTSGASVSVSGVVSIEDMTQGHRTWKIKKASDETLVTWKEDQTGLVLSKA